MIEIRKVDRSEIPNLSKLATRIVREHYDSIIGVETNSYMLDKFQSEKGITSQFESGYEYYWAILDGKEAGFFALVDKVDELYISKFYVAKEYRGQKIASTIFSYIQRVAKSRNISKISLNVNKHNDDTINIYKHFGFAIVKAEIKDIGHGFIMDDYVMECTL